MTMWSLLVDDGGGEDVLGRLEELLLLLPAITANAAVPWTLALLGTANGYYYEQINTSDQLQCDLVYYLRSSAMKLVLLFVLLFC